MIPNPQVDLPLGHEFVMTYAGTARSHCGHQESVVSGPCNKSPREHRVIRVNFGCAWCSTTAGMNVLCSCSDVCAAPQCPADVEAFVPPPVPVFERRSAA